ncbi:MAG: AAA domain-containing protein, partial [Leptospiraceae bacterium]|nr:AAA domain-containing protein [Leptospiraceae bacterium]
MTEDILNYRKISDVEASQKKKEREYLAKARKQLEIEEEILQESIEERNYTSFEVSSDKKYLRVNIEPSQSLISEKYIGESFLITSKSNEKDFESLDSFVQNLYETHSMEFQINPLGRIREKIAEEGIIRLDKEFQRVIHKKQTRGLKNLQFGDGQIPDLLSKLLNPDRLPGHKCNIDVQYFNKNLDESQKEAIKKILSLRDGEFFVLQGPPGTGKTTVILEIIQQVLYRNENAKILVSSQSNHAVDKVIIELIEKNPKLKVVRVGNSDRIKKEQIQNMTPEKVTEIWLDEFLKESQKYSPEEKEIKIIQEEWQKILKGKDKGFEEYLLKFVQIIGATCVGIASRVNNMHELAFDWVIIDEAGRAT